MTDDYDVIATSADGTSRVILQQDLDCARPMDDDDSWVTSVLVFHGRGYGGSDWELMRDPADRLETLAWFESRDMAGVVEPEDAFKRWMRIFHHIEVFDVTIVNGYRDESRGLAWVEPSEAERVGIDPGPALPYSFWDDMVTNEIAEHNRWAVGDCWGYRVQTLTTWAKVPEPEADGDLPDGWQDEAETRQTWEDTDDACWGFIGREYAEAAAKEAFDGR